MADKKQATQCRTHIDGPKVARWVVAWRKQCGNKTTDPSGYCHIHRTNNPTIPFINKEHLSS